MDVYLFYLSIVIVIVSIYYFVIKINAKAKGLALKNEELLGTVNLHEGKIEVILNEKIELQSNLAKILTEQTAFEEQRKKFEEKNKKIWQMSEAALKEKQKIEEQNLALETAREKLEAEKKKLDEKVKKLWETSTAVHKEKERINSLYEQIDAEKKKVDEKNAEIIESINYALKIQTAILAPVSTVKQHLPDSFVLYLPKDILSGDFYWMQAINDQVIFAACDSTGHGVPGAMVSLVCYNALNRAVLEFNLTQPALILDKVCELVIDSFKTSDGEVKDGMDISLCSFNPKTRELQWSGANNPLWLINNNVITEIKADKQPIGNSDYGHKFTNHSVELKAGTTAYLFSDGYADQFGGPDGKKLTRKKLKQLLIDIQAIRIAGQGDELKVFIENYKRNTFQTDDILVMGVKF